MSNAGKLDRRIIVQRSTVGQDAFGGDSHTWETLTTLWASRSDVNDTEKASAGQINATLMSRFIIRSSTASRSITAKDRLSYDGGLWDIHGIKETKEGRKRFLEITAMRQAD